MGTLLCVHCLQSCLHSRLSMALMESEATIKVCITWRLHRRLQDELMRNTRRGAYRVHRSSGETTVDGRVDRFDTQMICHVHTIFFVTIQGILTALRLIFVHAIIQPVSLVLICALGPVTGSLTTSCLAIPLPPCSIIVCRWDLHFC